MSTFLAVYVRKIRKSQKELVTLLKDTGKKTGDRFPNAVPAAKATYTDAEAKAARG